MNVVEVRDLRKHFDPPNGPVAVDSVSFDIHEGEIFSLLGPNGAGKTTTISMLSCLLKPSAGEAWVAQHSILEDEAGVKASIGVVPQEVALYEDMSGRENLLFWGRMYGLRGRQLEQRVDEVLSLVGLVDRQKDRVGKYSGGMKRRINIGAALLHRPRLLYLDEPTVGIDPQSRRAILDGIRDLNASGVTILYTTHYMEEAQDISDRIGIMDHGKMIALGTHEELVRIVGEATRVTVGVDKDVENLISVWTSLEGVAGSRLDDGSAELLVEDATAALPRILELAAARGARVTGLSVDQPNLETVFLHLTGRALRN